MKKNFRKFIVTVATMMAMSMTVCCMASANESVVDPSHDTSAYWSEHHDEAANADCFMIDSSHDNSAYWSMYKDQQHMNLTHDNTYDEDASSHDNSAFWNMYKDRQYSNTINASHDTSAYWSENR